MFVTIDYGIRRHESLCVINTKLTERRTCHLRKHKFFSSYYTYLQFRIQVSFSATVNYLSSC